jgi:phage gp29-like protein
MANLSGLLQVLATADNDIFHKLYLGLLLPRDEILREKGGSWGLKIYEEIERDAHAYSVLQKRRRGPLAYPWEMEPASDKLRDKKCAEVVKKQLKKIQIDNLSYGLSDGILKGYAVSEIVWALEPDQVVAKEFRIVDQRRIRFMADTDAGTGWKPRLLTWDKPLEGIEIPDRKFVIFTYGSLDGNPMGIGLGQKLYWPAWFKRNLTQFWLEHSEKFASPTIAGAYPAGFSEIDQDKLLQRLVEIKSLGAAIYPEGMDIKALTQGVTGDGYERAVRYFDEEMSKATLGETLTTTMGDIGSYAASNTHNDVRLELAQADANDMCECLNQSVVHWIAELNCPGAEAPRMVRKIEQPSDQKAEAEKDGLLFAMGYRPGADRIEEVYGPGYVDEHEEEVMAPPSLDGLKLPPIVPGQPVPTDPQQATQEIKGQPPASGPGGAPQQAPVSFAAVNHRPDPADAIVDRAMDSLNLGGLLDPLRKMVHKAKSLDDLRRQLDRAYPDLHAEAFAEVMSKAFTVAALTGQWEVINAAGLNSTPRRRRG